ncbi:MAG: ATP-dependent DNA helicase RecG [Dermatophilaceae bacterium]
MTGPNARLGPIVGTAATALAKARGIQTAGELLEFLPTRYVSYDSDLGDLHEGDFVVVVGEVRHASTRYMRHRKGQMLVAALTDGRSEVEMTFFNARGHEAKLRSGVKVIAGGQVSRFRDTIQLAHPGYTILSDLQEAERPGLFPLYPAVPKLHNWNLVRAVKLVLDAVDDIPDPIPATVRARRHLLSRRDAYAALHRPDSWVQVESARQRMRYEEAFLLQAVLAQHRADREREAAQPRVAVDGAGLAAFDARLPFTLTEGQRAVAAEIAADLAAPHPMYRLLQGDVGSGKTVLALRAMLTAVDAGAQAALLAPTEVLATQHHRTITDLLGDLAMGGMLGGNSAGTRVRLLTGALTQAQRRAVLLDIASGDAGIVIGTHALLQDKVTFADLALVVVDEQHRFGVEQRDVLRSKAATAPHVLVMTATPIPRTVAMTAFGDLDVSTLTEKPAGRSPVVTHVVDDSLAPWVRRTWERVAEECRKGGAAYVVCPRIGGEAGIEDDLPAAEDVLFDVPPVRPPAGVVETFAELQDNPTLAGLRIGILHGRMPPDEKDEVMTAFGAGELDVLVATSVIEVGVDVSRATIMVIRDADRFGVSQLHQLRGRVGRGDEPGVCLLMTGSPPGPSRDRLDAVAATTDGFVLARLDLRQRREGDILGARQSGGGRLRFLSLLDHEEIIEGARADARALVAADPGLERHPELRLATEAWLEPAQAEFLDKG